MKAKRLRDGKIVEVEKHGDAMIDEDGKVLYFDEICEVDEPDLQQARIQFVGQIASAIMSNYEFYAQGIAEECKSSGRSRPEMIAQMSLEIADALVAEIKHSEDVYAECRRLDAINTASVCENMTKIQNELQKKGGQDGN